MLILAQRCAARRENYGVSVDRHDGDLEGVVLGWLSPIRSDCLPANNSFR